MRIPERQTPELIAYPGNQFRRIAHSLKGELRRSTLQKPVEAGSPISQRIWMNFWMNFGDRGFTCHPSTRHRCAGGRAVQHPQGEAALVQRPVTRYVTQAVVFLENPR